MAIRTNLDMDVLRSFATAFELGSFARAAERLGRSQSALSTQLRKLEDQVGQALVQKSGRGLALTPAGENLFSYAKRLLELNDEALDAVRGGAVEGWVRLGLPQDFAESWLPAILGRFTRANPKVRVEVRAESNASLLEKTMKGELDLALAWGSGEHAPHAVRIADLPVAWIGPSDWPGLQSLGSKPLALVAFEQPCVFRSAGIAALDAAGIPWRITFISASLAGLWAAAEAGLGITLRTAIGMPKTLAALDPALSGLPPLPDVPLALHRAELEPDVAVSRLAGILRETISEQLGPPRQRSSIL
ncbi:MAG TPA: LysR substrate-binding domain-containing protein [Janthinobacterium sp.]|nr:LysR substrate-binding domain-containing protein [Janthinobacterium sp.]